MTLREAMAAGVKFARKRDWEPGNYLELPPIVGGFHGPWCKVGVRDPDGVIAPEALGLEQAVLLADADDGEDDWEAVPLPLARPDGGVAPVRIIGFVREVLAWIVAAVVVVLAGLVFAALAPPAVLIDRLRRRKA